MNFKLGDRIRWWIAEGFYESTVTGRIAQVVDFTKDGFPIFAQRYNNGVLDGHHFTLEASPIITRWEKIT